MRWNYRILVKKVPTKRITNGVFIEEHIKEYAKSM